MKVIFAQGNPGTQYARTRHNVGFMVLDALAADHGSNWKADTKNKAEIAEVRIEGEKILLIKPTSFYNDTGLVARSFVDFYKLTPSEDLLVLHDELALPFGTIRVRDKGSDAGNNGIKSINTHLGPEYWRVRIGIWNELRDQIDDANFVLSSFTSAENEKLQSTLIPAASKLVHSFVQGGLVADSQSV